VRRFVYLAAVEKIKRVYLGTLLRLTLLVPDLVKVKLNAPQP
jgi:hypothetical protein